MKITNIRDLLTLVMGNDGAPHRAVRLLVKNTKGGSIRTLVLDR